MSDHAFLSPSAATRWLTCAPAPHREAVEPDSSSSAARVGTAAHELLEKAMSDYSFKLKPTVGSIATNGVEIDSEMAKHVYDVRRTVLGVYPGAKWLVEKRVPIWKAFDLEADHLWGTADLIGSQGDRLIVADLKYGKHSVSPKENHQLLLYAIGASHACGWRHDTVDLVILQPRVGKTFKRWSLSTGKLKAYRGQLRSKVIKTLSASIGDQASPGNHCYFCKARNDCPERAVEFGTKEFSEFL